jgi:hypothetical protein
VAQERDREGDSSPRGSLLSDSETKPKGAKDYSQNVHASQQAETIPNHRSLLNVEEETASRLTRLAEYHENRPDEGNNIYSVDGVPASVE